MIDLEPSARYETRTRFFSLQERTRGPPLTDGEHARTSGSPMRSSVVPPLRTVGVEKLSERPRWKVCYFCRLLAAQYANRRTETFITRPSAIITVSKLDPP